jgi:hypothetical protein
MLQVSKLGVKPQSKLILSAQATLGEIDEQIPYSEFKGQLKGQRARAKQRM